MIHRRKITFMFVVFLMSINTHAGISAPEYIWTSEMSTGWNVNSGEDRTAIPPIARLYNVGFAVPQSNPDRLIVKIRMDEPFDLTPLDPSKKLRIGFWIYSPSKVCANQDNCDLLVAFNSPVFAGKGYPTKPTSQTIIPTVYEKGYSGQTKKSECPVPWWIDSTDARHGEIDFQLSITCLNIPKEFLSYAFADVDTGLDPMPFNFTQDNYLNNPFHALAANAYSNSGGLSGLVGSTSEAISEDENPSIGFTYFVKGSNPIKKNKSTTILVDGYCNTSGKFLDIQAKYKTTTFVTLTKNVKCVDQAFSAKVTIWGGSTIRVFERASKRYSDELLVGIGEKLERSN